LGKLSEDSPSAFTGWSASGVQNHKRAPGRRSLRGHSPRVADI
jgi:hypothetical protein